MEFCDLFLEACSSAILKGSKIGDMYSNGTEFCESRRYQVKDRNSSECFYFDEIMDPNFNSNGRILHFNIWTVLIALIMAYIGESILIIVQNNEILI